MLREAHRINASELTALQQVCHAFASTTRWSEARESVVRWVRAAVGLEKGSGSVRVLLPDSAGQLRLAWSADEPADEGWRRSAQRRTVFQTKVPMHVPLGHGSGSELLIQPLVCRGNPVGVLEVEAPRVALAARQKTLDAVAGLVAVVLRNVQSHRDSPVRGRKRGRAQAGLELGLMWTAHELRAPLLGTKAALDRALMTPDDESGRIALLQESSAELQRLAASIEPLLRLAVGEGSVVRQPTTLAAEVLEAIRERPHDIDRRRLRITATGDSTVRVDGSLLRHAIANIIMNALKFSTPGSRVRVSIEVNDGVASVRVVNRGPRIRMREQQDLFEPFVRDSSAEWANVGQGLGLSIAKRIVEAHGGVIWWRSSRGDTTFCIELLADLTMERSEAQEL
jgi:signal transduction histidine kinase